MRLGSTLAELQRLVRERFGIAYLDAQLPTLEHKLTALLPTLAIPSLEALRDALVQPSPAVATAVAEALTIGETYFFRNRSQFDALEEIFAPVLRSSAAPVPPIMIWSAGCATGEEPYSLAMWFRERAPWLGPEALQIVATDLNRGFLHRAEQGAYREWSFRRTSPGLRRRFFRQDGDQWRIDPSLKALVRFEHHNLQSGLLPPGLRPGTLALVFCRNVLIYFDPELTARVLESFRLALRPEGVLVLGHAESYAGVRARFSRRYFPGTFYFLPHRVVRDAPQASTASARSAHVPREVALPAAEPATKSPGPLPALGSSPMLGRRWEPKASAPATPASQASPRSGPPALALARAAADAGRLVEALEGIERYLAKNPTELEAHLLAAVTAEELGTLSRARQALKAALFLDRNLAIAHYLLAALEERLGSEVAALRGYRSLDRLLRGLPGEAEVPFGDGLTLGLLRELAQSRLQELEESAQSSEEASRER